METETEPQQGAETPEAPADNPEAVDVNTQILQWHDMTITIGRHPDGAMTIEGLPADYRVVLGGFLVAHPTRAAVMTLSIDGELEINKGMMHAISEGWLYMLSDIMGQNGLHVEGQVMGVSSTNVSAHAHGGFCHHH